jgi:hypothetical protein
LAIFKVKKRNQNETALIYYRIETFPYTQASEENKTELLGTISNFSKISLERFCLFQATQKQNKTFLFLKKCYQNETKTFQIAPGFLKHRTKLLVVQKFF